MLVLLQSQVTCWTNIFFKNNDLLVDSCHSTASYVNLSHKTIWDMEKTQPTKPTSNHVYLARMVAIDQMRVDDSDFSKAHFKPSYVLLAPLRVA